MNTPQRIPATDITPPPPRRRGIKNLAPGLVERGKIKIGNKGAKRTSSQGNNFQMPQKLDHFLITTTERGNDNNFLRDAQLHKLLGDTPKEIPIVLIYDDIELNFQTRYAAYNGRTLWCSGDGETAQRAKKAQGSDEINYEPVACPCPRQAPTYQGRDKCKINGTLSVMIRGAEAIGGVWKFRTTSYNSVVGIMSSLALIQRITGGPLAGIPLVMTINPKSVADPIKGNQQTIYVVGVEYRGGMEGLQEQGHNLLLNRTTHGLRIEHIEEEARQLISYAPTSYASPDDVSDDVEEFYPDALQGDIVESGDQEKAQTETAKPQKSAPVGRGAIIDSLNNQIAARSTENRNQNAAAKKPPAKEPAPAKEEKPKKEAAQVEPKNQEAAQASAANHEEPGTLQEQFTDGEGWPHLDGDDGEVF